MKKEIKSSDWKILGIPEQIVNQLQQAGIDCAEAFRQLSKALIKCKPVKASDFSVIQLSRELNSGVEFLKPNFSRFQNNFKRRGQ